MSETTMEKDAVAQAVRAYVVENFYYGKASALRDEINLMEDGAVDSTGFMELVTFVENHFPITVQDEDLIPENFASVERIVAYILRKSA